VYVCVCRYVCVCVDGLLCAWLRVYFSVRVGSFRFAVAALLTGSRSKKLAIPEANAKAPTTT
jgi:hypothetical protein